MPLTTSTITPPGGSSDPISDAINKEKAANPTMVNVQHPTKFGMLLKVMQPMLQGAVIGGFGGKSNPGGGFAAANEYFQNRRMMNLQMGQFAANMAKLQSEIAKNQAEA